MSEITVPNVPSEVEYQITTSDDGPFTVPFPFFQQGDVKVFKRDDATGIETELVLTTDWYFSQLNSPIDQEGVGFGGGTITLQVALADHTIKIFRDTIIDRLANYPSTGPFAIYLLNNEFSKLFAICQELEAQKEKYISLPDSAMDTTGWDAAARALCNLAESAGDACAATNRQVDANGPNWLTDNDIATAVGAIDQWNTVASASAIVIEGNDTTKLFDLLTQFYTTLQNRGGAQASFYIRYRYQVDCYSMITKIGNASYPIRIGASSAIPFSFMDIAQDVDYANGNCTISVYLDVFPIGASSASLYGEWSNLAVNTSEPR